jgi:hypothetical protein
MKKSACLLLFTLAGLARGTELTDLGAGLAYLRIPTLTESAAALRKAVPGAGALVLDLRYVATSEESTDDLRIALADRPGTAPLFILVSPSTPSGVAQAVGAAPASALTLGLAGSRPAPQVVVQTDPASDRRAYEALAAGVAPATLISGKIEKERFDEATLMQEFNDGNPDTEPPSAPDPTATKEQVGAAPAAPLVDRVLQRAVHLHQALIALEAVGPR